MTTTPTFSESQVESFWSRVDRSDDDSCWPWLGAFNGRYGRHANTYAHRFSYALHHGEIPDGHDIHHTCNNPLCVNPAHLEAHNRRTHAQFGAKAQQERCVHGHPLDGVKANGTRYCRICNRRRALEAKKRKHAAAKLDPSVVPHGTSAGYYNYGCRCQKCKQAQSAYDHKRRSAPDSTR